MNSIFVLLSFATAIGAQPLVPMFSAPASINISLSPILGAIGANGGGTASCAATNIPAGATIFAFAMQSAAGETLTFTDNMSSGNTFTNATLTPISGTTFALGYVLSAGAVSSDVITVTTGGALGTLRIACGYIAGLPSNVLDVNISGAATGCASCTTGSFTPTSTNEAVLVAMIAGGGPPAWSATGNIVAGSGDGGTVNAGCGSLPCATSFLYYGYLLPPNVTIGSQTAQLNQSATHTTNYAVLSFR